MEKKLKIKRPYRTFTLMAIYFIVFIPIIIAGVPAAKAMAANISFPVWFCEFFGYIYIIACCFFFARFDS